MGAWGMHELPAWVKKTLDAIGLNSSRVQWKYHYFREGLARRSNPFGGRLHWFARRQKSCPQCGTLVGADERRCPMCNARIPTRIGYLLRRTFGFMGIRLGAGVTPVFLAVFVLLYVLLKYFEFHESGSPLGAGDVWGRLLIRWGALYEPIMARQGEWWRLLTMALLHGGIVHLFFNSYAIFQLGPLIEMEIGGPRTLVVITITQLAAALASLYLGRDPAFSVGASGFLFGLVGFGIGYYWRRPDPRSRALHGVFVQWGIYALLFGLWMGMGGRIDNTAHMGGGAAGIVMGVIVQHSPSEYHSRTVRLFWRAAGGVCLTAWIVSLIFMLGAQKGFAF
ncbi:MAG: hypothetical protein Kow0059_08360 [Candidatus Sumerlaeia bacterium]